MEMTCPYSFARRIHKDNNNKGILTRPLSDIGYPTIFDTAIIMDTLTEAGIHLDPLIYQKALEDCYSNQNSNIAKRGTFSDWVSMHFHMT